MSSKSTSLVVKRRHELLILFNVCPLLLENSPLWIEIGEVEMQIGKLEYDTTT